MSLYVHSSTEDREVQYRGPFAISVDRNPNGTFRVLGTDLTLGPGLDPLLWMYLLGARIIHFSHEVGRSNNRTPSPPSIPVPILGEERSAGATKL